MIAGTFDKVGVCSLLADARAIDGEFEVFLHLADEEASALLRRGAKSAFVPRTDDGNDTCPHRRQPVSVLARERSCLFVRSGRFEPALEIHAAPGTELRLAEVVPSLVGPAGSQPRVFVDSVDGGPAAVITGLPGIIAIRLPLRAGAFVPMGGAEEG